MILGEQEEQTSISEPVAEFLAKSRKKVPRTTEEGPKIKVNTQIGRVALYYEKIRNVVDYQEERLFFRNAIARILKRKWLLRKINTQIGRELIHELILAGYLKNNRVPQSKIGEIEGVVEKYKTFWQTIQSQRYSKYKIFNFIIDLISCRIVEVLKPHSKEENFVRLAFSIIGKNIAISPQEIDPKSLDIQIELAIRRIALKSGEAQLSFRLFNLYFPDWPEADLGRITEVGRNFDQFYGNIQAQLSHPQAEPLSRYIKRNLPPLLILEDIILDPTISFEELIQDPKKIRSKAGFFYSKRYQEAASKILQGTIRAVLFILLTKTILAFILELPYDAIFVGKIHWEALAINVITPPLLMFVGGLAVPLPSKENTEKTIQAVSDIIYQGEPKTPQLQTFKERESYFYRIFDFIYGGALLMILGLVVWLLRWLNFNVISIILFFLFVSIASFLTFMIRGIVRELEMEPSEGTFLANLVEFFFLPFIRIGRWLSFKLAQYNIFLLALDFLIEAPIKVLIRVAEAWWSFILEKKERLG